jgi:hypothetical protein
MVFNATFNNISVIAWWSVLLVEETRGPGENHWPVASHWQTLSHKNVMLYTLSRSRFELTTSVVIDTDCIGSCKSNYHTIMATTAPRVLCNTVNMLLLREDFFFEDILTTRLGESWTHYLLLGLHFCLPKNNKVCSSRTFWFGIVKILLFIVVDHCSARPVMTFIIHDYTWYRY